MAWDYRLVRHHSHREGKQFFSIRIVEYLDENKKHIHYIEDKPILLARFSEVAKLKTFLTELADVFEKPVVQFENEAEFWPCKDCGAPQWLDNEKSGHSISCPTRAHEFERNNDEELG